MKVLFADASSLCRYSTILVARQSLDTITVLEAEALYEVNVILTAEKVLTLFINLNILEGHAIKHIETIRNLQPTVRIILVVNTLTEYRANMQLAPHVEGFLCLEDTLENSKAYIDKILNDNLDTDRDKNEYENRCSSTHHVCDQQTSTLFKAYTAIVKHCWADHLTYYLAK